MINIIRLTRVIEHENERYVNINDLKRAIQKCLDVYSQDFSIQITPIDVFLNMIEACDFMNEPDGDFDFKIE